MTDLISRLSEKLDEAERVAKKASRRSDLKPGWHRKTAQWSSYLEGGGDGWAIESEDGEVSFGAGPEAVAAHIASWDPQSVLRLVAAHRDLVRLHERVWIHPGAEFFNDAHLTKEPMPICASCAPDTQFRRESSWPCRTLVALAAGWGVTEEAAVG